MNTTVNRTLESRMTYAMPAAESVREMKCVGVVWARGACRQSLGLEILHDLIRTQGIRRAEFSCKKHDLLLVDYDSRHIDATDILNAICRPGVWAKIVGC